MGNGFRLVLTLLLAVLAISTLASAEASSADGVSSTDSLSEASASGGTIEITGDFFLTSAILISENTLVTGSGGTHTITRGQGLEGNMFVVATGIELTLNNIIIDGGGPDAADTSSIIRVNAGGELNLGPGSMLRNNHVLQGINGGAVYLDGAYDPDLDTVLTTLNITGGSITGNSTDANGGGVASDGGSLINLTSGTISGNTAAGYGGGIYAKGCNVSVIGGNISGNHANDGGGLSSVGGNVIVSGGRVDNNTAEQSGGGLLYLSNLSDGYLKIQGSTEIKGNTSKNGGGIAYISQNDGDAAVLAEISGTVAIRGNIADLGGGLFFRSGDEGSGPSKISIAGDVSIRDNAAVSGGGVYSVSERQAIITDPEHKLDISGKVSISNNSADIGGGIASFRGSVRMYDTVTVSGNMSELGGGLYMIDSETVIGGGSSIKGNTAGTGGGAYVRGSALNISEESKVTGNHADSAGGIYVGAATGASGRFILSGTGEISRNTSGGTAGGILIDSHGSAEFTDNGIVTCNVSIGNGNGVHLRDGGSMIISGSPRIGRAIDDNSVCMEAGTFMNISGEKLGSTAKVYIGSVSVPAGDGMIVAKRSGSVASDDEARIMIYTADLEYSVVPGLGNSSDYVLLYVERYEITSDIQSDPYVFPMAIVGYEQQSDLKVRIFNVGNHTITHLRMTVSGMDRGSFNISDLSETSIVPGDIAVFSIRPNNGLAPGKYVTYVAVSGSNGTSVSFDASFTVSAFEHVVITDDVNPNPYIFPNKTEKYSEADPLDITIRNTADRNVTGLTVHIAGRDADRFILGSLSRSSISPGNDTCYFSVTPVTGLDSGTYVAAVSVNGDDGAYTTFSVSFTVSKDPGPGLGIWIWIIAAVAAVICVALMYLFVLMRPVGIIKMVAGEGITIIGKDSARRRMPYRFSVKSGDTAVNVTYRIGAGGEWKKPRLNSKGQYEIHPREVTDHITIRAKD